MPATPLNTPSGYLSNLLRTFLKTFLAVIGGPARQLDTIEARQLDTIARTAQTCATLIRPAGGLVTRNERSGHTLPP